MRPHFLRAFGFEVDFATSECVRLDHFRDFELTGGYMNSAGTTQCLTAEAHMVSSVNRNGGLRVHGGNFSNGGNFGQIYLNCNDSLIEGSQIQPPNGANKNCVYIGSNSRKAKIRNNGIGECHVYTNPTGTVGVRVEAAADKTSIVGNDFYNLSADTVIDAGSTAKTYLDANKGWGP